MDKTLDIINSELVNMFDNVLRIEAASILGRCGAKLSMTEVHTIAAIGTGELKSMSEVAENLHITVGTLTVAINNLVKKGYVERYRSEKDRRIVRLGLTKQGKKVYYIHEEFHMDMVVALTKGLSDSDMDVFVKVMSNLDNFVTQF